MAVYIDQKIEEQNSTALKTFLVSHKIHPLVAVASYDDEIGGLLNIYQDDGTSVGSSFNSKPNLQVTSLEWHPVKKILAVGLENGELYLWNGAVAEYHIIPTRHKHVVSVLKWSHNGNWLMSADVEGTCMSWKMDSKSGISAFFHNDLKEPITDIIYRSRFPGEKEEEISRLARAAVNGDEKALNLFSGWSPPNSGSSNSTRLPVSLGSNEPHEFFVGSASGVIFYISDNGSSMESLQMESAIRWLLHYAKKDMIIVVTEALVIAQYEIGNDASLTETSKIKMGGQSADVIVIWAGEETLAVCAGEKIVRLWNVDNGQNNVLSLEDVSSIDSSELLTCISFQPKKCILAAGTSHGHIITWKKDNAIDINSFDENWQVQSVINFQGAVRSLDWGYNMKILSVITAMDVYILSEQEMCNSFNNNIAAVQLSARKLAIELINLDFTIYLQTESHIKAVFLGDNYIAVSGGKKLQFYEIDVALKQAKHLGSFSSDSTNVAIREQSTYILNNERIEIRTFQGTLKQTLTFIDEEGLPLCMDLNGQYLACGTSNGFIKIWDISRREAKPHSSPKHLNDYLRDDGYISSVKCNNKGSKVSVIIGRKTRHQEISDPFLYVWDIENDCFLIFNFGSGKGEDAGSIQESASGSGSPSHNANVEMSQIICGRYPVSHFWVSDDSRLLACEAKLLPRLSSNSFKRDIKTFNSRQASSISFEQRPKNIVVFLYVTSEHGFLIHDCFSLDQQHTHLLGVQVPYYFILQKVPLQGIETPNNMSQDRNADHNEKHAEKSKTSVVKQTLQNFVGLEKCDTNVKEAILSFSFYLTIGNMDEAFKAIKVIKNESVWENMARMCVKTKRLDVAIVCLGKMGHARGAQALRKATDEPELDARVAVLAIQLGMLEDAEMLLKNCNRYDMLNKMYQDCGQWGKAIEVADLNDRVHLRGTYYNYAKHLENKVDLPSAITMYEKSETHYFEVPRMLFEEPRALEAYIVKRKDKEMHKWWAQYLESIGEMETALQFYEAAEDYYSLVRVYCYCSNFEKASEIANETGDKAACFHLGRQFENQDNIKEAIHFFTKSQAYNNAIRICKEHGLEEQLLNLALTSGPQNMADVARYYEEKPGQQDKAVMLYHKAGFLTKAVELAFKAREYGALQSIANDLGENTDPQLLLRCAEFFIENGQYEKAVDLLAVAKQYIQALDLCVDHNIIINEELAEKMTIDKEQGDPKLRSRILEKIGECCMLQENYHLAAKKFTQSGNRVQAMKALLKSGNTEKIIFFAGVSRQKEIYVMAANYLQSLDWKQDPEIMKNIIGFYTKGKALDLLAGFYDACAQVEIDEYQNYEKGLGALNEALKCISKAQTTNSTSSHFEAKAEQLRAKMELVKQLVQIHRLYESSPEEALKQCRDLLQVDNLEIAVRRGDVYGFMVEHYVRQQNFKAAHNLLEEMKSKLAGVNLSYHIKLEDLKAIYKALNIHPVSQIPFLGSNQKLIPQEEAGELSENEVEEEYPASENGY